MGSSRERRVVAGARAVDEQQLIERHSIHPIPLSERHGKVWHQGPFWFEGNFVLTTVLVGFTGPLLGLSIGWSVLAIASGVAFGTFFMAFHANQGPRTGLPQLIQSRPQFGRVGTLIPTVAAFFIYLGFVVSDMVLAGEAISRVADVADATMYVMLAAVGLVLATVGYRLLHAVQRWLSIVMIGTFVLITVAAILAETGTTTAAAGSWNGGAFAAQFVVAAGYNISYSVYVSDYTRYLRPDVSAAQLIAWTYAGAASSALWLMSLGAVLAAKFGGAGLVRTIEVTGDSLIGGFGVVAVLLAGLGLVAVMGVELYGGMMTGLTAVDSVKPLEARRSARVVGVVAFAVVAVVIALALPEDYSTAFDDFVSIMLYMVIPWTAVNLVDFYIVRRRGYDVEQIVDPGGFYGAVNWRGTLSYAFGLASMVPFLETSFFTGPILTGLGGVDISFVVGLVVAGLAYVILHRDVDLSHEWSVQTPPQPNATGAVLAREDAR